MVQGLAAPIVGALLSDAQGRAEVEATLVSILQALPELPDGVLAGVSGHEPASEGGLWAASAARDPLSACLASVFGLKAHQMKVESDIALLCRCGLDTDLGITLNAGTGSVAAFWDGQRLIDRTGGHGPLIDDAGSAHWIGAQALRWVWRNQDAQPGGLDRCPLAQALAPMVGGGDRASTRRFVQSASRGAVGRLAVAVAAAAHAGHAGATSILEHAAQELAQLVHPLLQRHGPAPVLMAGRVWALHPLLRETFVTHLPAGITTRPLEVAPHLAAAQWALRALVGVPPQVPVAAGGRTQSPE